MNAAAARATEIKLIHIGRSALGLDDSTYRLMLANLCAGKTSSTDLTDTERQAVLAHLKSRGFVLKARRPSASVPPRRQAQMSKLRAMWYVLADAGEVTRPANAAACDAAIETWAKRQLGGQRPALDALRFAGAEQMNQLIEAMKAWARRVGVGTP